jgi:hypothetical protein
LKFDLSTEFGTTKAAEYLARLSERGKPCEVKEIRKTRSNRANAYYWALVMYWGIHVGYTKKEAHRLLKREYGLVYEKNGNKFLKSTADLETKEMAQYIEWFRNMSQSVHGVYLASPEEYEQGGHIEINNFIEQNREYL